MMPAGFFADVLLVLMEEEEREEEGEEGEDKTRVVVVGPLLDKDERLVMRVTGHILDRGEERCVLEDEKKTAIGCDGCAGVLKWITRRGVALRYGVTMRGEDA